MPETLRLDACEPTAIDRAAALLRAGGTVAFPTETVYGLGANALLSGAVAKIFKAKGRPAWDPLIVHLAQFEQLARVATVSAPLAGRVGKLAAAFWPGPLTLLLPRTTAVPDAVTAGRALVGVRIPAHPVARRLLRLAGVPIAAPSANRFGHTSPTTAQHVLDDLDGRIDAVLDGGAAAVGVESTVLDPQAMVVYRPGAVTLAQIAAVCGASPTLYVPLAQGSRPQALPSPGVGIRHYAPRARLVLCGGSKAELARFFEAHQQNKPLGVFVPDGWGLPATAGLHTFEWGKWDDPDALASRLFMGLRALDDAGVAVIVCPVPAGQGVEAAIRDRLEKAARA